MLLSHAIDSDDGKHAATKILNPKTMNPHILLVEDEVRIAQLVELELSDAGYQVNIAHDGQVGLELAQAIQPDAIVLDWTLPNLTGLEICQQLRAAGNTVPIVFATAMDDPPHRQAAMAAGANAYVVKPYSIHDLMETLTAQLPACVAA